MPRSFFRKIKKKMKSGSRDIDPEDIFLDSANLPGYSPSRFHGRLEEPFGKRTFFLFKCFIGLLVLVFVGRLGMLDIVRGATYSEISKNNALDKTLIFANRGVIFDRTGLPIASNAVKEDNSDFASRVYAPLNGLSHVVGYVKYPSKDSTGRYYDTSYHGIAGAEKEYDSLLAGANGSKLTETDALGHVVSESLVEKPVDGRPLYVSIDAGVTDAMYKAMISIAGERGFSGGAGVIMDVRTGELLALTSFPAYDQNVMTAGMDKSAINRLLNDPAEPFLDRAVSGLYTPGSIVKPIVALGALDQKVIDPLKKILSTGSISIPNAYDPSKPSIFKDWRAQGWIDMDDALAVSSDVYFYEVGGGFEGQKGLGIDNIDKYFTMFGLTTPTGIDLPNESTGTISSIAWKAANFPGDAWRLGDTYHTAIGQYGTQVTPLEAVRWAAAIANGGKLLVPTLVSATSSAELGLPVGGTVSSTVDLPQSYFNIVRAGMRQGVTSGIATALNVPYTAIAAKSGTAELGVSKVKVNSWITGFFPYDDPHYAFAVIMEQGPATNTIGATYVMRQTLDWMSVNRPQYLK